MEPMKKVHKRWMFWSLIISFFVYSFVVYTSGTTPNNHDLVYSPEAKMGKETFQKYNCISCHQIMGLGGYMGPDLTNVISDKNKGEAYARAFIISGTERMPKFPMSNSEIDALVSYLKFIGNSVNYPLTDTEITWYGTIETKFDE